MDNTTRCDKYDRASIALIQYKSIKEAAAALRISVTTLWRWSKDPEFQRRYRLISAQFETEAMATLREAETLAASTLVSVLKDPRSNPVLRVQVADKILRRCENRPAFAQLNLEDLPPEDAVPVVVIPALPCGAEQLDSGGPRELKQPDPEAQVVPIETALPNAADSRPQAWTPPRPIGGPEAQVPELKSAAPSAVTASVSRRRDGLRGAGSRESNQPNPDATVVPLPTTPKEASDGQPQAAARPKTTGSLEAQVLEPRSAAPSVVAGAEPPRGEEHLGSGTRATNRPSAAEAVSPATAAYRKGIEELRARAERTGDERLRALAEKLAAEDKELDELVRRARGGASPKPPTIGSGSK